MDVVSLCPLRAASLLWRQSSGAFALTVICKATFELRPGEMRLAAQQEHVTQEDNHWDDDPNRSLRAPSDLVPFKPRADVMLVGQAFAPNKTMARSLLARLSAASVEKVIEVCGERTWTPEAGLREGVLFASMQLRYERAANGMENPVGIRVDPRMGGPLPNLQIPGGANGRRPDATTPVGFGPIAPIWPTRRARLGAYAASFPQHRWDEHPLPEDFDPSFFNSAPVDQQPERIEPGTPLTLENLSPQYARLVTKVPRQRPRAFVERNGTLEELSLICDTLWIDTDRGLCTLTWRGQIGVHGAHDEGRVSILLEQPNHVLTWPEIQQQCANGPPEARGQLPSVDESDTAVHEVASIRSALEAGLPFLPAGSKPRPTTTPRPWRETTQPAPTITLGPDGAPLQDAMADLRYTRTDAPRVVVPPRPGPPPPPPVPSPVAAPAWSDIPPMQPASLGTPPPTFTPPPLAIPVQPAPSVVPPPLPPPLPSLSAGPAPRLSSSDVVELVGCDPTTPDLARGNPRWQELIAKLQPAAKEVEYDNDPVEEGQEVKDRRDVFGVLTEAEPTSLDELEAVLGAATSPSGVFDPPLLALRGELELTFNELETLKATLAAVAPFTSGPDKKLKDAFDSTTEALKSPYIQTSVRAVEGLTSRLRDAFPQVASSLPAGYLDQQVERILVEQRHYQKRIILGKTWVRALLGGRGTAAVPTYVPEEIAAKLPLYARFAARLIVQVNLQQDQYESHPCALLCLALARAIPSRPAARGRSSTMT